MPLLIFLLVAGALVWAPLPWGSNHEWPTNLLTLWIGVAAALIFLDRIIRTWRPNERSVVRLTGLVVPVMLGCLLLLLMLAQTLAIPSSLHAALSDPSLQHKMAIQDLVGLVYPGISFTVDATMNELLAFGSYILVFVALAWFCAAYGYREAIFGAVLVGVFIQISLGFVTNGFGIHFAPVETLDGHWSRMRGSFINGNHFACYVNFGAMIILGRLLCILSTSLRQGSEYVLTNRHYVSLALYFCSLLLCAYAIARSGSRGAFAALLTGLVFGVVIVLIRVGAAAKNIVLGVLAALSVTVVFAAFSGSRLVTRIVSGDVGLGERLGIWQVALRALSESPLFGFGAGSFETVFLTFRDGSLRSGLRYDNAHSDVIQTLFETGVIGFMFCFSFVIYVSGLILKKYFQTRNIDSQRTLLCGILVIISFSFNSLFEINFRVPANAFTFMVLMATAFATCLTIKKTQRTNSSRI